MIVGGVALFLQHKHLFRDYYTVKRDKIMRTEMKKSCFINMSHKMNFLSVLIL